MPFVKRERLRLENYSYSCPGAYFITICTKNKQCIFSDVVGDGVHDVPKLILTEYGKIVARQLETMNSLYENIDVEKFIVMPNHVHLLVRVLESRQGRRGRRPLRMM